MRVDRKSGQSAICKPSHPSWFKAEVAKAQPGDVAAMFFTSGTTGNPKGVVHTHNTLLDRASAGAEFDKLTSSEEVLAYLPPAWIGQNIFSYAQWLACGYVVNCPESASTVTIDLKEVGPTYYFRAAAGFRRPADQRDDPHGRRGAPSNARCSRPSWTWPNAWARPAWTAKACGHPGQRCCTPWATCWCMARCATTWAFQPRAGGLHRG